MKKWIWWLRGALLTTVFISMGWLSFGVDRLYASPDESANAFFAQTFATTGQFCLSEPLNDMAGGLIHPRSTVAPGTCILPTTFLGFPLINGIIFFIFGGVGMMMFAPILAIGGVMSLWWIIKTLTKNERLADWSALLLLIHPAFWLYSARSLMVNVPFVALIIIGIAIFIIAHRRKSVMLGLLAGIITSIGFSFRLVDAPVFIIVAVILLVVYRRSIDWRSMTGVAIGVILMATGYLGLNFYTYGSALVTGYSLPNVRSVISVSASDSIDSSFELYKVWSLILPFGFHPRAIVRSVLEYGFLLYPVTSMMAVVGMIIAWRKKDHRKVWRLLVGLSMIISVWLAIVYGSWSFADNPDPKAVTIGNSHVRYWLPVFVIFSVFAGLTFDEIWKRLKGSWKFIGVAMMMTIVMLSAYTVFTGSDGLIATRKALMTFDVKRSVIVDATESDAVVIVDRADKYVFPSRRVIVPLRSDSTYAILSTLVPIVPTYYFGITFPAKDFDHLNNIILAPMQLSVILITTVNEESLYRIIPYVSN